MKSKVAIFVCFAAAAGAAHAQAEFNPFTGARVETEQVKGLIELQREKNNLAKEKLEARRLDFQTKNVDKVLQVELRKLIAPAGSSGMSNFNQDPLLQGLAQRQAKPKVEQLKGEQPADPMPIVLRGAGGPQSVPVSQVPKLVMVMDNGQTKRAVVEHLGQAHTVRVGDRTPLGTVSAIEKDAITIGGKKMTIDKTVVAINNPDAQNNASMGGGKAPNTQGMPDMTGMPPGIRTGLVR